jgi:hypothetical protein
MYMKWNPFLNAAAAAAYIGVLVLFMHGMESLRHDTPDTLLDGMGVISLFVFSAAVMAFLFFYQPAVRLVENKKAEAVSYFLKTLGVFGLITVITLILVSLQ